MISVEDPRVMLVRSLHGPPSPNSLPGDTAAIEPCKQAGPRICVSIPPELFLNFAGYQSSLSSVNWKCHRHCHRHCQLENVAEERPCPIAWCMLFDSNICMLHLRNICSGWSWHLSRCLPSCSAKAAGQQQGLGKQKSAECTSMPSILRSLPNMASFESDGMLRLLVLLIDFAA